MAHFAPAHTLCRLVLALFCLGGLLSGVLQAETPRIKLLFLGDQAGHRPSDRFRRLQPALEPRGIDMVYTDDAKDLNPTNLAKYDGLVIYANTTNITPDQEQALLDYVQSGKGFIPIHCASYCFLNSPKYIALVGAQFKRHGTGTFRAAVTRAQHPILQGYQGFESWDETYVHHLHNEKDRTVLEYRQDTGGREPWTWVRTEGKGKVFYTAWGHDDRTWSHPGFQNLIERGIRWAVNADLSVVAAYPDAPQMTPLRTDVKPFEYVDADIPVYVPGQRPSDKNLRPMQLPLAPAESHKHLVTPVGFEVQLFAAEPEIGKPICLNWDHRGRLWLAETVDYPNDIKPAGAGRDRIRICEDTDHDGRADKFTIFADKLSIPTSFTFANGGIIVTQAPQTLFLKDTNGDDVADERRELFSGWSTGDTHAGPSNLNYGLDNWIYGMAGYAGFDGTIGGERHQFRTGFYRFKPDASKFEFLRNTNNNSWGVGFNEEGVLFGSTANGNPSVYLPIPNRYYEAVRGWSSSVLGGIANNAKFYPITDKVRQVDHHGNFSAAAGHALYTARTYPREYWNRTAFVAGPEGHLLATFVIEPAGSDFRSRNSWNLLASNDEWTAPIMGEVGPDGHVWVIDWYNYIVQHNPTPAGFKNGKGNAYETDLRDKKHGRIYRVVYKAAGDIKPFTLQDATPEKLVATLKHENFFWRRQAQRLLVERNQTDVVPALIALLNDNSVDAIGLNPGAIHALWTLQGLGAISDQQPETLAAITGTLKHPSAGVRRNAVQVLPRADASLTALLASGALQDRDLQVRLMAFLALAELPPQPAAGAALVTAFADPVNLRDRWIPDALTAAAARHDQVFLEQVAASGNKLPAGAEIETALAVVADHYARGVPNSGLSKLLVALPQGNKPLVEAMLAGLARGWPKRETATLSDPAETALGDLLKTLSPVARGQLVTLAIRWGSQKFISYRTEITAGLLAQLKDEKLSIAAQREAANQLIDFERTNVETVRSLLALVSPKSSPELSQTVLEAIGRSEAAETANELLVALETLSPKLRPVAIRVLLSRADWTPALVAALEQGKVQVTELSLDQKQSLASHPNRAIAKRAQTLLAQGGGLPSPDRQKVLDELLAITHKTGDVAQGKVIFTKQCAKCHRHSGEGQNIGPDLTGMAVHPKHELLIHILDPNRSVEGNFRVYTVVTEDGRVLTGLLASETKNSVEIIDAEGKRHAVQREDIEQLVASTKSLMPEGFEKQVTPDDMANLLEFMTQRGKYLPLPFDKVATVVTTKGMFHSEDALGERMIFDDWKPKTFNGVPFLLVDPQGTQIKNAIMLGANQGKVPPTMPKSVKLPCNGPAKAIHLLSGVSGWGHPYGAEQGVTLIVRLHYADGKTEDHPLKNGEHFADYIRRIDVPGSQFAFDLKGKQLRYLSVIPSRIDSIKEIELVKGADNCVPVVMAVTVESP